VDPGDSRSMEPDSPSTAAVRQISRHEGQAKHKQKTPPRTPSCKTDPIDSEKVGTSTEANFATTAQSKSTKSPRDTPRQSIKSKDKNSPSCNRERAKYNPVLPRHPKNPTAQGLAWMPNKPPTATSQNHTPHRPLSTKARGKLGTAASDPVVVFSCLIQPTVLDGRPVPRTVRR
jgi:hypothetical protein